MRFFAFLTGFVVFIYTLSIGNYVYAGNFLNEEEKTSIRDRIVSEQIKINNLYVKFNLIITKDNGERPLQHIYEWAMSGEKQYRKRYFCTPVGEPLSERFGLAVWDGKFLKAYDSLINNGSIRNKYDSKDPRQPKTNCPYTRHLGSLNGGLISKMLTTTPLGNWEAEWMDNGTKVVFRYKMPGYEREWTFDLEKNCMITKFASIIKSLDDGKIASDLKVTVSEFQEVKPGIWLPTKSNTHAIFYTRDKTLVRDNDIVVDEIKVNEPEIEELFRFEFPEGAGYYDYIIGKSVRVYAVKVGDDAPEFNFKSVKGKEFKLTDFRGKVIFLHFWSTWCSPCVAQMPKLKDVYQTFSHDKQFALIGLNADKEIETLKKYIKNNDLQWLQSFLDEPSKSTVKKEYGIRQIPANFLIGADGKIIAVDLHIGDIKTAIKKAMEKFNLKDKHSSSKEHKEHKDE